MSFTALVIGEVIAVGIFLTPAGMAKSLGSPLWLLAVWLAMGAMALAGALCYGELAARFPQAGGGYVYLKRAYGPAVAFLYGWKCLLVMDPGITAALAVGLTSYVGYLMALSAWSMKLLALGVVWVLATANILGLRLGAGLVRWLTALKLGALSAIIVTALALRAGDWDHFLPLLEQRPGSDPLLSALAGAMVGAFFAFGGWWEVAKMAGEARNPGRTVPRALALGVVIVTLVYVATSAVFLYLVPMDAVTSGETFAAQAGEALFGAAGGQILALVVIISVAGSLATLLMALPRVYYAMARDGVFFRGIGKVHPRFGTPARASALQAGLASVLILLGNFEQIISYFIFVTVAFVGLTGAGVCVLRSGDAGRPSFRVPGYPLVPLFFLLLVALLLVLLAVQRPLQAGLGVGVMALGAPVYYLIFRRS
ncbi:MAG TPA: amino acid permease [Acidobacteriota bacterium]|nr:amino acid permease [Acidobacteriota bacterium]